MELQEAAEASFESLWNDCLERVRSEIPDRTYKAWFAALQLGAIAGDEVRVLARNEIVRDYVAQHYKPLLEKALADVLGGAMRVLIELSPRSEKPVTPMPPPAAAHRSEPRESARGAAREAALLKPEYSFDSFVEGECNRVALSACRQVAAQPGSSFANPLVLVGGSSLGKTHLLQAIGNFAWKEGTARKVVYRTSEEFSYEFLKRVVYERHNRSFRDLYRDADIVLIDDIQFFGGRVDKQRFRAEMVNLLAALQNQNKQVILSCDQMPSEVQHFDKQILSRIETGLIVNLTAPDLETRLAILRRKASDRGWGMLSDEVLEYIAESVTDNVRHLEGALLKLCAFSDLCNGHVDRETAQNILSDTARNHAQQLNIASIAQAVAEVLHVDPALLSTRTRKHQIMVARHLAMLLASELTDNTLSTIGLHFGRDYSTVHHSLEAARELLMDPELKAVYEELRSRLAPDA